MTQLFMVVIWFRCTSTVRLLQTEAFLTHLGNRLMFLRITLAREILAYFYRDCSRKHRLAIVRLVLGVHEQSASQTGFSFGDMLETKS
jgi:hypothetical protein